MLWYSRLLGQDPLCPTPLPTWHPCSGCSGSESTSTAKESRCHVPSSMTVPRAGRGTAQACTKPLCWCARAPTQLYSQGANTELWRCGQAPKQALICPWLSKHPATGWMGPLPCKNTWQPLASYSRVTRKKGDSTWLWWLLQLLWSYKIFQHFHEMVRKEEYE